jgi:hypothetical protein
MRNTFSLELLKRLHLARYVYLNEEFNEIYAWFSGPSIKIFEFTGDEVGEATIVNESTKREYSLNEEINFRDVTTSIDSIVRELYTGESDE